MIRLAAALVVPAALILASAAGCVSERIGVDESHPAVLDARRHPGHGLDQADVHAIRAQRLAGDAGVEFWAGERRLATVTFSGGWRNRLVAAQTRLTDSGGLCHIAVTQWTQPDGSQADVSLASFGPGLLFLYTNGSRRQINEGEEVLLADAVAGSGAVAGR